MFKIYSIILVIIVSSYFFPVSFMVLPAINTKLMLAVIGVFFFIFHSVSSKKSEIDNDYLNMFLASLVFSLTCFCSVVLNGTSDYAYTAYFMSMFVWLFGAYAVCYCLQKFHGYVTLDLLSNYLILVCVLQCFLALFIDSSPSFKNVVDSIFALDQFYLNEIKRLYGIGAALDTAGIRFSLVLVLLAHMIQRCKQTEYQKYLPLYLLSFFVIAVVGNMIARTTSVGVIMGCIYLFYQQIFNNKYKPFDQRTLSWLVIILVSGIVVTVCFYNTNAAIRENIRFAFEGFFNLFEKGEWEIGSNEQLKKMIVFPDTLKTWILGDGYFNNPVNTDPYFIGEVVRGYYMGTDVGYLRFIFYSGLIGLISFSFFICRAAILCIHKFPQTKTLIIFLFFINFICWLKVSTDTFLIFALIMMAYHVNKENLMS